jgi:hypothetical protein
MLPHHRATGLDVKVKDQPFAACCVCADPYYSSLTGHGVLVHFAGFQHFTRNFDFLAGTFLRLVFFQLTSIAV